MNSDAINELWIDTNGSICVRPESKTFEHINRSPMGIAWNSSEGFLYPEDPGSLSHLEWFRQILIAVRSEYGCDLHLTLGTSWSNIEMSTRDAIEELDLDSEI